VVLLIAAVGCPLVLAVSGCGGSSAGRPVAVPPRAGSTYTLMQMNLCLSGLAGCYGRAAYPAVVDEALARIREARPDAVTFNEACRSDVARLARLTGYHLRFSRVIYRGERLRCVRPGGRGLFGDAGSPRRPSRAPTRTTSRRKPASSGAGGCASRPGPTSTCAPPT
jgi:hypothetical protein